MLLQKSVTGKGKKALGKMGARKADQERAGRAVREFLEALGLDLKAAGMEKTPERVAKMYALLFSGVGQATKPLWGEVFTAECQGLVAVRHIPFYSMCEHHLLPFFGEVHLAYLPHEGKVAGFGKFSRLVDTLARRPQLQERLTQQIAAAIEEDLSAEGVMAIVSAQQLCMMIRGELSLGTRTLTAESRGRIQSDASLQQQAWQLLMEAK